MTMSILYFVIKELACPLMLGFAIGKMAKY